MSSRVKYVVYLINMDRSVNRLKLMEDELHAAGLDDYQRVTAVDGQNLAGHDFIIQNRFKKNLNSGEIGCFLSHVRAMHLFVASSSDYAVVLEDDAKLKPGFKQTIEMILSQPQAQGDDAENRWDVLKLYNGVRRNIFVDQVNDEYFIGSCGPSIPSGTVGAVWTKDGARKFLSKVMRNGVPVVGRPIDCELQHPWEYGLTIYNLLPSVVESLGLPTQIQSRSKKIEPKVTRVVGYELSRLIPKYRYYLKRHGWRKFIGSFVFHENDLIP